MDKIFTIWFKELKDTVRDRRTVTSMIVLPVIIMPLILIGITKLTDLQTQQAQNEKSTISIINAQAAPSLVAAFTQNANITVVNTQDVEKAVENKDIDLGITIPNDFSSKIAQQTPITLKIDENLTSTKSALALTRLVPIITVYNQSLYITRLSVLHISPSILSPVSYSVSDLSTTQEKSGLLLGYILPVFIVLWSVAGGQYVAIDISAGEKERKTLEALLLTPTSRIQVVFGKIFAVATVSLISVALSLGSIYFSIKHFGLNSATASSSSSSSLIQGLGNISVSLNPQTLLLFLLVSVLLVIMFSAILLSIGIFAKSYREAQSYIAPAYIIVVLPIVFANIVPNFKPTLPIFSIPVVNAVFLDKELLLQTYNLSHILVTVISLMIFSFIAVFIATRIYNKESVLFN